MNLPFRFPLGSFQPNPFRFLLYTEWVMLASCASMAVVEMLEQGHLPIQHLSILGSLGLMGLILPDGKLSGKILYTSIEVGLIFYGTMLGYLHILPTLYLIVVIRSCFLFELPGRWLVTTLSFALFMIHQAQYARNITLYVIPEEQERFWMHQLSETLMFALGLLFVLQLINTLIAERQTQQQLAHTHEKLRQYALQVEELAAIQERNRIARDIHDSLGHALTALNVQLQTAKKLWDIAPTEAKSFLNQAHQLGDTAIEEVRKSVRALRVDAGVEESLEIELASLIEDFRQGTGISVSSQIKLEIILPPYVIKTIYRLVQEALTNICKHAQASKLRIQLLASPENVCLTIEDNGRGFKLDASNRTNGFGLQGMKERVASLDGEFDLITAPGIGCLIKVNLPLQALPIERPKIDSQKNRRFI
jgi:signal transduction histidine kinase